MKQFMARVLFPNGKEETLLYTVRNNGTKGQIKVQYMDKDVYFQTTVPKFLHWFHKMGAKEIERVEI